MPVYRGYSGKPYRCVVCCVECALVLWLRTRLRGREHDYLYLTSTLPYYRVVAAPKKKLDCLNRVALQR